MVREFYKFILLAFLTACTGSKNVDKLTPIVDPFAANGNSAISFSPIATDFGVQRVMNASLPKTIIVTNDTSVPVYLSSIGNETNVNFSIVSSTCPTSPTPLAGNASCNVSIIFNPQTTGNLQWSFGVTFDRVAGGSEYQTIAAIKGLGATTIVFAGVSSIDQVRAASMRLNWVDVAGENGFFIFKVNASNALEFVASVPPLSTSYTATGLTPSTSYTWRVQAVDLFGNTDTNTANLTAATNAAPTLTAQQNMFMTTAAGPMIVGNTYNFDFNNVALGSPGNDTNMTYSCYYDTVADGAVAATLPCSGIPGFSLDPAFSTNGQFSWTPPVNTLSEKTYELLIRGNDGSYNGDRIFAVEIRDPYVRSNLVLELSAPFARNANPGQNSPRTTTWDNLLVGGGGFNASLLGSFATGWLGDGTDGTNPYRLAFDGTSGATASRATLSSPLGLGATFAFSTWIKPTNTNSGVDQYLFSDGGTTLSGWSLRQTSTGKLSLDLGISPGYEGSVMAQGPTAFYKFEESSGLSIADSSGNGNTGTVQNAGLTYSQVGHDGNSFNFSGNAVINVGPFNFNVVPDYTLSVWVKTPLLANGQWKTVSRGSDTDHQIIFEMNTSEFGSYYNSQGGFFGSGIIANNLAAGWHLFSIVSSATGTKYYVDGAATPNPSTPHYSTDNISYIGNYQGGGQAAGDLDGVAIFSRALAPYEIMAQYLGSAMCQTSLIENYWQNISGIFDGSIVKLFSNGNQVCSMAPVSPVPGTAQLASFGAKSDGSSAWAGELADFRIYSSLTAADVTTNFNSTLKRYLKGPDSISNLKVWLDATDPLATGSAPADGTSISTWKDKSGLHNDAPAAGTTPVWSATGLDGFPSMHYGGAGAHTSNFAIGSDYTIVMISKLNGNQNARVLGDWTGGNILLGYWNNKMHGFYINNNPENLFSQTTPLAVAATTAKNWDMFTRSSAGPFTLYSQGTLYATSATSSNPTFKLQMGCGYQNLGECSNVFISEIIIYDRVLTGPEMAVLNSYVQSKWGF